MENIRKIWKMLHRSKITLIDPKIRTLRFKESRSVNLSFLACRTRVLHTLVDDCLQSVTKNDRKAE